MKKLETLLASVKTHSMLVTISVDVDSLTDAYQKGTAKAVVDTFKQGNSYADLFGVELRTAIKYPVHSPDEVEENPDGTVYMYLLIPTSLFYSGFKDSTLELLKAMLSTGGGCFTRVGQVKYETIIPEGRK